MPPLADSETGAHRQQDLYFRELVELKIGCDYARLYREQLRSRITAFAAARARHRAAPSRHGPLCKRIS